jgi:hypothetical protein
MAITHAIATSHSHVTALPNSYGALDFTSADSYAELFSENHVASYQDRLALAPSKPK